MTLARTPLALAVGIALPMAFALVVLLEVRVLRDLGLEPLLLLGLDHLELVHDAALLGVVADLLVHKGD